VVIFAAPDARLIVRMCLCQTGDIDEETIAEIYPPRVDDVQSVAPLPLPDPWVDIEKIDAFYLPVFRGIGVFCLIVDFAKVMEGCIADLSVKIKIPRQSLQVGFSTEESCRKTSTYLAVPPPS
jgi:hypothetical protein